MPFAGLLGGLPDEEPLTSVFVSCGIVVEGCGSAVRLVIEGS